MKMPDVITAANQLEWALGRKVRATEDPSIYREGKSEAASHYVFSEPTHTEYLWWDGPHGRVGITGLLDVETDLLGSKEGTNILGTTDPLPVELDPEVSFPWNLVPYDPVTVAKLILGLWMHAPGGTPLFARKPTEQAVYRLIHRGAFVFDWAKVTREGVAGRANLQLMDDQNRATVLRLVQEMALGHFISEEEAGVLFSDLVEGRVANALTGDGEEYPIEALEF